MTKQTTMGKVRAALGCAADSVGRAKDGTYTARRGFFYSHGGTADKFGNTVRALLDKAGVKYTMVGTYEKWTAFRGGASVAQGTHWGATFRVTE